MIESRNSVHDFYNKINDQYTKSIMQCVPRYTEMQWAILRYIPDNLRPKKILDLGCGAGNLTDLLIDQYPDSEIHIVDISDKMIDLCTRKYEANQNIVPHRCDFRDLPYATDTFDLIVSSIAIHHINDDD
jgi:tRNA (cmo5U34)-methyltransferase